MWQNEKKLMNKTHFIEDHLCPVCKKEMIFSRMEKLAFKPKVGWTHLKCKDIDDSFVTPARKTIDTGTENHNNRLYFRAALRKALRDQRVLWDPHKSRIWDTKNYWRPGEAFAGPVAKDDIRSSNISYLKKNNF